MNQNRPKSTLCTSAGRGLRIQMSKEHHDKSKSNAAAAQLKEEVGQFDDAPATSPRRSAYTLHVIPPVPEPAGQDDYAHKKSTSTKTAKPGPKFWTDAAIDAVVNVATGTGRKAAPVAGSSGFAGSLSSGSPRMLPPSTQTTWKGRRTQGRTSLRGYDVDYVETLLDKEKTGPKMDEESWD